MVPGEHAASPLTATDVRNGLPRPVGVGIRRVGERSGVPALYPIEETVLSPRAVEQRRVLFALGRAAARDALAEFGIEGVGIGRGDNGEPLWPAGIVGAISHAGDTAMAIVGRQTDYAGLGLDVEEFQRGLTPRAARLICRPAEMDWVDHGAATERLISLFSAKEAVFKALFPIEKVWLGFADAELTWDAARGVFRARLIKAAGMHYPEGFTLEVRSTVTPTQVLSVAFC
jgi:4'-phosphopantetheinyl transferase EntD